MRLTENMDLQEAYAVMAAGSEQAYKVFTDAEAYLRNGGNLAEDAASQIFNAMGTAIPGFAEGMEDILPQTDPESVEIEMRDLLSELDQAGIYGQDVVTLFQDVCSGNIAHFIVIPGLFEEPSFNVKDVIAKGEPVNPEEALMESLGVDGAEGLAAFFADTLDGGGAEAEASGPWSAQPTHRTRCSPYDVNQVLRTGQPNPDSPWAKRQL